MIMRAVRYTPSFWISVWSAVLSAKASMGMMPEGWPMRSTSAARACSLSRSHTTLPCTRATAPVATVPVTG